MIWDQDISRKAGGNMSLPSCSAYLERPFFAFTCRQRHDRWFHLCCSGAEVIMNSLPSRCLLSTPFTVDFYFLAKTLLFQRILGSWLQFIFWLLTVFLSLPLSSFFPPYTFFFEKNIYSNFPIYYKNKYSQFVYSLFFSGYTYSIY